VSADSLSSPNGVSVDPSGGVYISDSGNSRVLYFSNPTSTTATQVYGSTDFTGLSGLGSTVTGLSNAIGILGDAFGLYIAFGGRVIYIPQNLKQHILAYGTGGVLNSFSSTATANSISSNTSGSISVFVGTDGKVFISDSNFNRVLMY
jgi:hypothetical protein